MVFVPPALTGNLANRTVSVLVLNPFTLTPVAPLTDLVPGLGPFRFTGDLVESESLELSYRTTENAVQDASDITSNVHRELQSITLTTRLASFLQLGQPLLAPIGIPSAPGVRFDFLRAANLQSMADQKNLVAVITPRISLPTAVITSISRPWSPDLGESTTLTITFREVRIANPLTGVLLPDYAGLLPGNNVQSGGGQQTPQPVNTTVGAPPAPNAAPLINPFPV